MTEDEELHLRVDMITQTAGWLGDQIEALHSRMADADVKDRALIKNLNNQLKHLKQKCELEIKNGDAAVDDIISSQ